MKTDTRRSCLRLLLGLAIACPLVGGPAGAAQVVIEVQESALDDFAAAISPIELKGRHETWFCESNWTANVTGIAFSITPGGVSISGDVTARWCDFDFDATLSGRGDVQPQLGQSSIELVIHSAKATVSKTIDIGVWEGTVTLGTFDVSDQLSPPPIPVRAAALRFEAAGGSEWIIADPISRSVEKRNGFLVVTMTIRVR